MQWCDIFDFKMYQEQWWERECSFEAHGGLSKDAESQNGICVLNFQAEQEARRKKWEEWLLLWYNDVLTILTSGSNMLSQIDSNLQWPYSTIRCWRAIAVSSGNLEPYCSFFETAIANT